MANNTFDKEQFLKSAAVFREKIELEELLTGQVGRALAVIGNAAVKLVGLCRECASEKGPVVTAKISESQVQISGGGRNVLLSAAHGVASDQRLPDPRAQICGQILVFSHLTGEPESNLIATLRVYGNGDLSDGELTWSIDSAEGLISYLAHIVGATIFQSKIYWPAMDDMPSHLRRIPLLEEELHEESLKRPCVGFECSLEDRTSKKQ